MGAIYGSENKKAYKSIQELSVPKKMTQTDSLALLEQKEKLIATLLEKQEAFELKYFILIGVLLFLVILFGLLCLLNKRGDKRLEKIVSLLEKNQKSDESNSEVAKDNTLDIDPVVIDAILENLKVFEQERGFLNPKITLYEFAKKLQTNTKYLSKVINTYKLKSFRNYINDLRVQYSIERLKQHRDYRNYTMHAMAQEAGFSNRESFSKAFQRKTGESVSDFLKQAPLK
ncbi:AraC family transcriptional regulator [uncultured Kordia sp.]|uniref:helix-turn-helix domain-containing protein n=1 Tax=uncultured Kordia sp. TaxID=507699 RepID=UPI0026085234|nr:helix-turn-helix domain-containing protein [uncultured Kordia sp.]